MNDKVNIFMTWLTYESGVLTERFQKRHLIVNYSILAVALVLYLLGVIGTGGITLACLPGIAVFLLSLEALAWKQAGEGGDLFELLMNNMPR